MYWPQTPRIFFMVVWTGVVVVFCREGSFAPGTKLLPS
jgi:hypothetical protein